MASRRWRSVALLAATLGTATAVPFVVNAARFGPAADVPALDADAEKASLIEAAQGEFEAAMRATLGPAMGPPVEAWRPEVVEGIVDDAESPFEGRPFELTNLWQSRLSADGRVTRVYAGTEDGRPLLIVLRQVLETGERELYREVPLPAGSGAPRLVAISEGVLDVATPSGRTFRLDVTRHALR